MNILILPEYDAATPHVVVDSVYGRLLPERGHVVHMLRPMSGAAGIVCAPSSGRGGMLIGFPPVPRRSRLDFFARVARVRRSVEEGLRRLDGIPVDVVLLRNDLIAAGPALRFARARRAPFVFQISSPEAEFRINGENNRFELRRLHDVLRGRSDLTARRRLCRRSAAVLAISTAMRRHLTQRDGIAASKVFTFPMGTGSQPAPSTRDVEAAAADLALPWSRTIVYTGVIDPTRMPSFMLDVIELVRRDVADCGLLVLTYQEDARRRAFEAEAAARNLPVRVAGPIHHSRISAYLRCADVMLCSVPPRVEFAMMSPTKSIEALAAGIPVVGSRDVEEHRRMLDGAGGGVSVPFDAAAFAHAIVSLLQDEAARRRMGQSGREWAEQYRSYPRLARYLESILLAAASGGARLADLPRDPDEMPPDAVVGPCAEEAVR